MRRLSTLFLVLLLGACASGRPGDAIEAIPDARVAAAFIALSNSSFSLRSKGGSAVVIAPGIAVTNAHNRSLIDDADVIGISRDYDLMFFRTKRQGFLPRGNAYDGQSVIAYGHAAEEMLQGGALRVAHGKVISASAPRQPNCTNCPQSAFVFQGNAGPGFSGGPVLDARDGSLIGITFGYTDEDRDPRKWIIYVYHMRVVEAELARLRAGN